MEERKKGHIYDVDISDIRVEDSRVKYNDEEMVFIDNLRDLPDFTTCKIAFNIAILCVMGRVQFDVGGVSAMLKAGQTIVCHSHVVMTNFMASPDAECKVLCVSDRILKSILQSQTPIWNRALYRCHFCIFEIEQEQLNSFDQTLHIFHRSNSPYKHDILICLLRASFLQICELLMELDLEKQTDGLSRMDVLFHRFLENISRRKIKKISIAEYAEELCITPKYLSTICKKVSDKSPVEWISEYVIEDITYFLKNTDLSSKEIANELGFINPSFFTKYVRQHLGMTPMEYRRTDKMG